jgi:hypothetical protein
MKNFKLNKIQLILIIVLCFSCAGRQKATSKANANLLFSFVSSQFEFNDKSGRFLMTRESGREASSQNFVVRQSIAELTGKRENLEQLVTFSQVGQLKNKLLVMRPLRSQYTVWFDGQRYLSEMNIDVSAKSMRIKLESPEVQWTGERVVSFPDDQSIYCFFSSLIECASITGFINTALEKKAGRMNLMIVWEGYPYMSSQYQDIPDELFTPAILEYDGRQGSNQNRFSLRFAGQSLFYFVNENGRFDRYFWVSQGLSVVRRGQNVDL